MGKLGEGEEGWSVMSVLCTSVEPLGYLRVESAAGMPEWDMRGP
jgi:hypothetical protein